MLVNTNAIDELIEKYKEEFKKLKEENEKLVKKNEEMRKQLSQRNTLDTISTSLYLQKHYEQLSKLTHQHEDKKERK